MDNMLSEEDVNDIFMSFLDWDFESHEYETPVWLYSDLESFNCHSSEKWAIGEVRNRILNGEYTETALYGFCADMLNYAYRAKTEEARDHFMNAYYYGNYLFENLSSIIYDNED